MKTISLASNIPSLQAQRRLTEASEKLSLASERLSSGMRINRASDDAASLAISTSLRSDSRVFTQGIRNVTDGLSYLMIAEGAVQELKKILYRGRELTTQSSNGSYSNQQRATLDKELQALGDEYNRIIDSTKFNGRTIFSEADPTLVIQAGYGVVNALQVTLGETREYSAATTLTESSEISIASVSSNEVLADSNSSEPSISGSGRYISFRSEASNLVSNDTNGFADIFVRDVLTGETTRVNVSSSGEESNASSHYNAISADGRYVAFSSYASNLASGNYEFGQHIFIHDRETGTTTLASVADDGTPANSSSSQLSISADGRYVAFSSYASNLVAGDTNGKVDIFVRDTVAGTTIRVNLNDSDAQANNNSDRPNISSDGRYVVFESSASNLVTGDTNSSTDVFMRDLLLGTTTRISVNNSGVQGNNLSQYASVSSDGRYVSFLSTSTNLVAGDTNGRIDTFVRDTTLETTTLVSVSDNQVQGNANSIPYKSSISSDGRYIVFASSATNLVSDDSNGLTDIFVHDLQSGKTSLVVNSLGMQANAELTAPSISADGRYISFYSSASNLVPGDTNGLPDIFRASNPLFGSSSSSDGNVTSSLSRFEGIGITTQSDAYQSQESIDQYFTELNNITSNIGAMVSRLNTNLQILGSARDNFITAASRIDDADVASETAYYIKNQTAQKIAALILAQTNQSPEIALRLLAN